MSRKAECRAIALAARRARPESQRHLADQAIRAGAVQLAVGRRRVAAYLPLPAEPGGAEIVDALSAVAEVILPVLRADRDLDWARYEGPRALRDSAGGTRLREPAGPPLGLDAVAEADLVLVPALAVDRFGVRLGRGGGSYDRALTRVTPGTLVVALLYDGESCDRLPAEPHDRPVGAVLSPSGLRTIPMS